MKCKYYKNWKWWVVLPIYLPIGFLLFLLMVIGESLIFIGESIIKIGQQKTPKWMERLSGWVEK